MPQRETPPPIFRPKTMMRIEPDHLHGDSSGLMPEKSLSKPRDSANLANQETRALPDDGPIRFPLFELPLELREYVYRHVLVQDKQPLHLTRRPKFDDQPKNQATAILATNREVYLEARRVFLSCNEFLICGTLVDHKWLKGLGPEGQKQLRKVIFLNGSQSYSSSNHRIFSILSGCPKLSLTVEIHWRQLVNLKEMDAFKYMHGFSQATAGEDLSGMDRVCPVHQHGFHGLYGSERETANECVQSLLRQFKSACPRNCRVHKARVTPVSAATVHIDCEYGCPECYHSMFGNWQWQWQ